MHRHEQMMVLLRLKRDQIKFISPPKQFFNPKWHFHESQLFMYIVTEHLVSDFSENVFLKMMAYMLPTLSQILF